MHSALTMSVVRSSDSLCMRVQIDIDGFCLLAKMRDTELTAARDEAAEGLAGNYALPLLTSRLLRHLGCETATGILLNCPCDMQGCWPLTVRIRAQGEQVIWDHFCQLRHAGRWGYGSLEPMIFDRAPYNRQIRQLRTAWRELQKN